MGEKEFVVEMKNIWIEGFSDERWHELPKESTYIEPGRNPRTDWGVRAGKSTLGLVPWVCQTGLQDHPGEIVFDGTTLSKRLREKQHFWGTKMAYVAQSAARPSIRLTG